MQRRKLLKTIAVGGVVSMGAETVAGIRPTPKQRSIDEFDVLYVLRDGESVRSVENPTDAELRQLQESLGSDEVIVDSLVEPNCITYCKADCDVACEGKDCQYSKTCADTKYCCPLEEQ